MSVARVPDAIEPLWDGPPPAASGQAQSITPTLSVFLPARSTGSGVVIIPGGAYQHVALEKEGYGPAAWFNSLGIAAFALNYRCNNTAGTSEQHPVPLLDARRAMRLVRSRAAKFGIDPDRLGLMGFSAGGHLAATVATSFDQTIGDELDPLAPISTRPDVLMLIYPVITLLGPHAHTGSCNSLLGQDAQSQAALWSAQNRVTERTPPTFLLHTGGDNAVPAENSIEFYLAIRRAGVPAEMHIYQNGPHGFGMLPGFGPVSSWPDRLRDWLTINMNIVFPKE